MTLRPPKRKRLMHHTRYEEEKISVSCRKSFSYLRIFRESQNFLGGGTPLSVQRLLSGC